MGCDRDLYEEEYDWGFYPEEFTDCEECQQMCATDENCGAVNCGIDYCIWWKINSCRPEDAEIDLEIDWNFCRKETRKLDIQFCFCFL